MKWITRGPAPRPTGSPAPWLITKFIDPDAEILYVPAGQVLDTARDQDAVSFDAPRRPLWTHPRRQMHLRGPHRRIRPWAGDQALIRLARIVHAADIAADLDTDPGRAGTARDPAWAALGSSKADDHRLLDRGRFVYDALYAWCQRQVPAPA